MTLRLKIIILTECINFFQAQVFPKNLCPADSSLAAILSDLGSKTQASQVRRALVCARPNLKSTYMQPGKVLMML